jgi:hypothetical protein
MVTTTSLVSGMLLSTCSLAGSILEAISRRTRSYSAEDWCLLWNYILTHPDVQDRIRQASGQFTWNPGKNWWILKHYVLREIKNKLSGATNV